MRIGEFRALTAHLPDDTKLNFLDPNYGGVGEEMDEFDIEITDDKSSVWIRPPYWEAVE